MKYIVVRIKDVEQIFVFPRTVDHDRMHEGVCEIRHGDGRYWHREFAEAISAGFIDNGACHGDSETLKLSSRGEPDTALLRFWLGGMKC